MGKTSDGPVGDGSVRWQGPSAQQECLWGRTEALSWSRAHPHIRSAVTCSGDATQLGRLPGAGRRVWKPARLQEVVQGRGQQ